MKQKLTQIVIISVFCLAISLLTFSVKNSFAFTETKTGKIETSQSSGENGNYDPIASYLESLDPNMENFGCQKCTFQAELILKLIEQLGESNYPKTAEYLRIFIAYRNGQSINANYRDSIALASNYVTEQAYAIILTSEEPKPGPHTGILILMEKDFSRLGFFDSNSDWKNLIPGEVAKLKTVLATDQPSLYQFLDSGTPIGSETIELKTAINCSHTNNYSYNFQYNISQGNTWNLLSSSTAHKCEQIKLIFTPNAEWLASMAAGHGSQPFTFTFLSPPTNFLACADQTDCLSKATEASLTNDTFGKGVQKVPADFVAQTEKSLISSNAYMQCTNGICTSYTSGSFPLSATAPANSYFGQCRGFGLTINTPEVAVPSVTSGTTVAIVNRPPVPTVSFAKNPIAPNEEVDVTCDIVDPDECSDKITKVKWICTDSNGLSTNCSLWKAGTGEWTTGTTTQDIVSSEQTNPFRANAKFRATIAGNYAVTCEATDNDANNPLTGTGIAGITVVENCLQDGICNASCPSDPDCGVIPAKTGYCALLSQDEGSDKTLCDESEKSNYVAYTSGFEPLSYQWKCDSSDKDFTPTSKAEFSCSYQYDTNGNNTHLPVLQITYKGGSQPFECVTQTQTTVAKEGKCKVEVAKKGSSEYKSEIDITSGEQVNARIDKECVKSGSTTWEFVNGSTDKKDNDTATEINFNVSATAGQVKAQITTQDGTTTTCDEAEVNIKEKVKFGI